MKQSTPKKRTASKSKNAKKSAWFINVRGSYLPANKTGWLCYVPFTILALLPLKVIYMAWHLCPEDANILCANPSLTTILGRVVVPAAIYYALLASAMTIFAAKHS